MSRCAASAWFALPPGLLLAASAALAQGRPPQATAGEPRSTAVFPPQEIVLQMSHARHLQKGVRCAQCHAGIAESERSGDRNIPSEARCAVCHEIEEARQGEVVDPPSACQDCHPGFDWTVQPAPRPSRFPPPNLVFSHKSHLARGAQCSDCHGDLVLVDLATRAQLPRMATCLLCHDGSKASAECATCHPTRHRARGALLETELASGTLRPGPGNPFGLDHGPRFERAHAQLAAGQGARCRACHAQASCDRCHAGATRPQEIHPGDFIGTHMVPARQGADRCDACHRRQTFCVACHERTGVGRNADITFRDLSARVHPGSWMLPGPGFHGVQAARGIGACASCHREEECLQCHSRRPTLLGTPVNPHPPGFAARCRDLLRKNDRACLKCHVLGDPGDGAARCR